MSTEWACQVLTVFILGLWINTIKTFLHVLTNRIQGNSVCLEKVMFPKNASEHIMFTCIVGKHSLTHNIGHQASLASLDSLTSFALLLL